MPIPETILDDIEYLFEVWRTHPQFDGSTLIPRAQWYVDGDLTAAILFPTEDIQPLAKSLHDVTATLGMLGDGIVVMCETWMKTATATDELKDYAKGDLGKDPTSGQAIIVMKIVPDDPLAVDLMPFGINDDGTVVWADRVELTGAQMGGAMPAVVENARSASAPLHAEIRRALAAANEIGAEMAPDEGPIGMGSVYRGAVGALAEMGDYMVAVTETLQEMP